ncbi:helix-turn-helix domain-containing protein [Nakamurella alba]|uniref:helix-turn-helix domain-containing protein n=1 Tax=Nakamurella alba TaxID=2665158 RepID=UPI0018A94CBA|nr:GAF domain-containing protein [Nakamurella alba]
MTIAQYFDARPEDSTDLYGQVIQAFEEVSLLAASESVPLDAVLRLVGQRLCELLGVTRCSVYLRREDGRFQGQVGYSRTRGNIDAKISKLVAGVEHDLFTAEIVATNSPVAVQDAVHDPRTIQRTMRAWGVRDMLGVPLVVDSEVIGIIYVDTENGRHAYSDREIKLAQAFAGLSALAVRQCWLHRQLGERASVIDRQRRMLGRTAEVHTRVTRAVMDGEPLGAILGLIVDLLGKPVVLYSPEKEPISWASPESLGLERSPALSRSVWSRPWAQSALAELEGGAASIMLRAHPEIRCRRLLARLVTDGRCVGYLELAELGGAFTEIDAKALEQAAMAVALKLLNMQRNTELRRRQREEFVADLLYGRADLESLDARAESFDFDLGCRHLVVRMQYATVGGDEALTGERRRRRVSAAITDGLPEGYRSLAFARVPGADLFILEVPAAESGHVDGVLHAGLQELFGTLQREFSASYAVTSEPYRSLGALHTAADKLREIDELLRRADGAEARFYSARELELLRLLGHRDGPSAMLAHTRELVRPLLEHDAAGNGGLVRTLFAFVRAQGQVRATAVALGVHENTVRYRLARIKELSAVDPDRLDSLLGVMIAIRIHDLFGGLEHELGA